MSHVDELIRSVPDLRTRKVLDLGCGSGDFLVLLAKEGIHAEGIEYNPAYVAIAREKLVQAGYKVAVTEGAGESLPYVDASFGFINASEVIEHVQDPKKVLSEMYCVLAPGGNAYASIPNRFGMRDQHYKLYFVNWLPRAWSDTFIKIFGRGKEGEEAGHQRLADMHYATYGEAMRLARSAGFSVSDIREMKIQARYSGLVRRIALVTYHFLRLFYFDSFHLLLLKS